MKTILLTLALLLPLLPLSAQPEPLGVESQIKALSDSLLQLREKEISTEYGFLRTDKLGDVARKLEVNDIAQWKRFLDLEPGNRTLDNMRWDKLGISPYRAFLAKQYSIWGFTELTTLGEVAELKRLPVKKLRQHLGLDPLSRDSDQLSLQALESDPEQIVAFAAEFNSRRLRYGLSVTAVGMLVVFSALLLTSLIINQLKRINPKPHPKDQTIVISARGKLVSKPGDLDRNLIAAAITALHLYKQGIEERRRLLLTFKRTPTNQWRASAILNMPNRTILRQRREP
jgi:hypothetical protein